MRQPACDNFMLSSCASRTSRMTSFRIPAAGQHVKSGRLKALGLASVRRSPAMPNAVPVAALVKAAGARAD